MDVEQEELSSGQARSVCTESLSLNSRHFSTSRGVSFALSMSGLELISQAAKNIERRAILVLVVMVTCSFSKC